MIYAGDFILDLAQVSSMPPLGIDEVTLLNLKMRLSFTVNV